MRSIDTNILRPTLGVRFISAATTALLVLAAVLMTDEMLPIGTLGRAGMLLLAAYAALRLQTYELRYNDYEITTRNALFAKVTLQWRDLMSMQDSNHYELVLLRESGGRLRIIKHLVGMADFVAYARHRMRENAEQLCPSFQKSKPFGVA